MTKIATMMGSATNKTEANNGGEEYFDDVYRILEQEHGYSINMSHKKAPTNMAKLTRIEQHAPTIRNFYFRDSHSRDEDYRKAMSELTAFSFTAKNCTTMRPIALQCWRATSPSGRKWSPWRGDRFN